MLKYMLIILFISSSSQARLCSDGDGGFNRIPDTENCDGSPNKAELAKEEAENQPDPRAFRMYCETWFASHLPGSSLSLGDRITLQQCSAARAGY